MTESDAAIGAAAPQAGGIQPKLRTDAAGGPLPQDEAAPSPESFGGRGSPLMATARGFFERRFGYDFGDVRVHGGADAAASARSLGARAYTFGSDIVFGAGEYAPGSQRSQALLAHELAHVVQQGAGQALVQRQPLDPWVEERIKKKELGETTGQFGITGKPQPIKMFFFPGKSDRKALVIAGVHGSERQGMEAAEMLMVELGKVDQSPFFTTIVIPSLFPDSKARGDDIAATKDSTARQNRLGADEAREYDKTKTILTNRNFPKDFDLDAWVAAGRPKNKLKDAEGSFIAWENLLLMELMERFRPERIISIHGTKNAGEAGVFYDKRELRDEEKAAVNPVAAATATLIAASGALGADSLKAQQAIEAGLAQVLEKQLLEQANTTDLDLSLAAATQIHKATIPIAGREGRDFIWGSEKGPLYAAEEARREEEKIEKKAIDEAKKSGDGPKAAALEATRKENRKRYREKVAKIQTDLEVTLKTRLDRRKDHPSIAGNIDNKTGEILKATWGGGKPKGISLGGYGPKRGMSVFTVEPALNYASTDVDKFGDKVAQADRKKEILAYAEAVRTVLLGAP